MRKLALLALILFLYSGEIGKVEASTAQAEPPSIQIQIKHTRNATQECRQKLGVNRWKVSKYEDRWKSEIALRWLLALWQGRQEGACFHLAEAKQVGKKIDRYLVLRSSPMVGHGFAFATAGRFYNVNPAVTVAAAGIESTFGLAACDGHNAWGLTACTRDLGLTTWKKGIWEATRWLRQIYGVWLHNLYTLGSEYCPPCGSNWGSIAYALISEMGFPRGGTWKEVTK